MTTLLLVALALFTLTSAFFSGSETTLFSLSPMQVRAFRKSPTRAGRLVERLLAQPRGLLVTVLMLDIVVNLLVQNISAGLFEKAAGWGLKVGLPLGLTLVFGEIIPKSIALPNNTRLAPFVAPPIAFCHTVIGPLRRALTRIASYVSKILFVFLRHQPEISREELRHALRASEDHGILSSDEADLTSRYLLFQGVTSKELMRPRDEIIFYDLSEPLSKLLHRFAKEECSRLPVCDGGLEALKGILEATDYLLARDQIKMPVDLLKHLHRPLYVPESMAARTLFSKLDEIGVEMAVVVDEYGSITGLITREDLIEVVVGDIVDMRDEKVRYTRAGPDVIIASGNLELTEFNDIFDAELSSPTNLVTIGGWLTEQLGALPVAGTKLITNRFLFHVLATDPNRIRRIYIRRLSESQGVSE